MRANTVCHLYFQRNRILVMDESYPFRSAIRRCHPAPRTWHANFIDPYIIVVK